MNTKKRGLAGIRQHVLLEEARRGKHVNRVVAMRIEQRVKGFGQPVCCDYILFWTSAGLIFAANLERSRDIWRAYDDHAQALCVVIQGP